MGMNGKELSQSLLLCTSLCITKSNYVKLTFFSNFSQATYPFESTNCSPKYQASLKPIVRQTSSNKSFPVDFICRTFKTNSMSIKTQKEQDICCLFLSQFKYSSTAQFMTDILTFQHRSPNMPV